MVRHGDSSRPFESAFTARRSLSAAPLTAPAPSAATASVRSLRSLLETVLVASFGVRAGGVVRVVALPSVVGLLLLALLLITAGCGPPT